MSGQYHLTMPESNLIKGIIERYIQTYSGDLYEDNEVSIIVEPDGCYIQFN